MEAHSHSGPMPLRWKRALVIRILAAMAAVGLLIFLLVPREPTYNGKKLSFWLHEWNDPWERRRRAKVAIEAMGTNALPHLARILVMSDASWKTKLRSFLISQKYYQIPGFLLPFTLKTPSVLAIKHLGTNAAPIISLLSRHINSGRESSWCLLAMAVIGPPAAPALELACQSTDQQVRIKAAYYLASLKAQKPLEVSYPPNARLPGLFKRGPVVWVCKMESNGDWLVDFDESVDSLRQYLMENLNHTNAAVREASSEALLTIPALPSEPPSKLREDMKKFEKLERTLMKPNSV